VSLNEFLRFIKIAHPTVWMPGFGPGLQRDADSPENPEMIKLIGLMPHFGDEHGLFPGNLPREWV